MLNLHIIFLARSHKKVLKRFRQFVINGRKEESSNKEVEEDASANSSKVGGNGGAEEEDSEMAMEDERIRAARSRTKMGQEEANSRDGLVAGSRSAEVKARKAEEETSKSSEATTTTEAVENCKKPPIVKPGSGADPDKPRARKAKDIRRERAMEKKRKQEEAGGKQDSEKRSLKKQQNSEKSLADFLDEPWPENAAHKFEVKTVWAQRRFPPFAETFGESLKVYQKYQVRIHGDRLSKVTADQFTR